jgi:tRNA nucleotidyltransferase (CCA-adding enzyme)
MIVETLNTLGIDKQKFESVFTPDVRKVIEVLEKYDFEFRIVGGAVRDFVLGKAPRDIDFATDADPSELIYIFNLEEIEHDDWGIGHGTIKAVFGEDKVDVTSIAYKLEIVDGRVRIITGQDWEQDAQHRDLTINSLSVDSQGNLYDYVGGLEDLRNHIIRMNAISRERIPDDSNLILRWFKAISIFEDSKWPQEDFAAIKSNIAALETIRNDEKTHKALAGIVTSPNGKQTLRLMCALGAQKYLGINCD